MRWKSIRDRLKACKVDNEILERSRLARVGNRAIQLAVIIRAVEPALVIVAALCLMSVQAFAQNTFGGSDQQLGNGLKEAIRYGRNLMFLLGVAGVGWGTFNIMTEKAWTKQMLGGGLAMSVGGIIELVRSFSAGNAVDLDTDLGN
jgi:hypothetical protein